jgi:hypothetical protein
MWSSYSACWYAHTLAAEVACSPNVQKKDNRDEQMVYYQVMINYMHSMLHRLMIPCSLVSAPTSVLVYGGASFHSVCMLHINYLEV